MVPIVSGDVQLRRISNGYIQFEDTSYCTLVYLHFFAS
jgi:hypothetical protein